LARCSSGCTTSSAECWRRSYTGTAVGAQGSGTSLPRCATRSWAACEQAATQKKPDAADGSAPQTQEPAPPPQPAMRWTLRTLLQLLGCILGVLPGKETVRRVLKELGYRWKKARKFLGRASTQRRAAFVQ